MQHVRLGLSSYRRGLVVGCQRHIPKGAWKMTTVAAFPPILVSRTRLFSAREVVNAPPGVLAKELGDPVQPHRSPSNTR